MVKNCVRISAVKFLHSSLSLFKTSTWSRSQSTILDQRNPLLALGTKYTTWTLYLLIVSVTDYQNFIITAMYFKFKNYSLGVARSPYIFCIKNLHVNLLLSNMFIQCIISLFYCVENFKMAFIHRYEVLPRTWNTI